MEIRRANPNEAYELSDLAGRSKSYWPYDEDYLRLCRSVTHVTKEDIKKWPFIVAVERNQIQGFAAVCEVNEERMLDHLWIDPECIGKGLGSLLFEEGVSAAKELGWSSFTIASDPYAENFYIKMGAARIGERESKIKKGFYLPLLKFDF